MNAVWRVTSSIVNVTDGLLYYLIPIDYLLGSKLATFVVGIKERKVYVI